MSSHPIVLFSTDDYSPYMPVPNIDVNRTFNATSKWDVCNRSLQLETAVIEPPGSVKELFDYPALLTICTFGNILILWVLYPNRPRTTPDLYMMILATSDLFIMWTRLPIWILHVFPKLFVDHLTLAKVTGVYGGIYIWLSTILYFLSNGVVLLFTLERVLTISRPFSRKSARLRFRTIAIIVSSFMVVGFLLRTATGIAHFMKLTDAFRSRKHGRDIIRDFIEEPSQPEWLTRWCTIEMCLLAFIVAAAYLLIPILNVALAYLLFRRKSSNRTHDLGANASMSEMALSNATKVSLNCACMFAVCQGPMVVYLTLSVAAHPPFCSYDFKPKERYLLAQSLWIYTAVYYSVNFYLYCAVSSKFRRQLMARFPCLAVQYLKIKDIWNRYRVSHTKGHG